MSEAAMAVKKNAQKSGKWTDDIVMRLQGACYGLKTINVATKWLNRG